MNIRQITGFNLKRIREHNKMTQDSLAAHLGIKKQNIYALEKEIRPLTDKTLELLCEIFSCVPEEFYFVDHNGKDYLDKMLSDEIGKMGRQCKAELYAKAVAINTMKGRGDND